MSSFFSSDFLKFALTGCLLFLPEATVKFASLLEWFFQVECNYSFSFSVRRVKIFFQIGQQAVKNDQALDEGGERKKTNERQKERSRFAVVVGVCVSAGVRASGEKYEIIAQRNQLFERSSKQSCVRLTSSLLGCYTYYTNVLL